MRSALEVERRFAESLPDYAALHAWSIAERAEFWSAVWDFCGVLGERGERASVDGDAHAGRALVSRCAPQLRREPAAPARRHARARSARDERGARRTLTWAALHDEVSRVAQALRAAGRAPRRSRGGLPAERLEAIVAMLAAASLGAIWSSCSPDFGVQGVLDRFGQIEPRVLFACDGYAYGGKTPRRCASASPRCSRQLPSVQRCVVDGESRSATVARRPARRDDAGTSSPAASRRARSTSSGCPSTTRSTSSIPRAPPARPSASCTAPAARCCSTSRSTGCTATCAPATASSTSRPAAG